MFEPLTLDSRVKVEQFDALLMRWKEERGAPLFDWLSLPGAFDALQLHQHGGRIFASLLDLRLSVAALECDLDEIGRLLRSRPARLEAPNLSLLDRPELMLASFDLHCRNVSFILRYRAILDKIMLLLVLTFAPDRLSQFTRARSRKRKFVSEMASHPQLPSEVVGHISKTAEIFDNRYRTAEAHGTGQARKWSFTIGVVEFEEPQSDMFAAWQSLHPLLVAIGRMFRESGVQTRAVEHLGGAAG